MSTLETFILWGLVIAAVVFLLKFIAKKFTKKGCGGGGSCGCGHGHQHKSK